MRLSIHHGNWHKFPIAHDELNQRDLEPSRRVQSWPFQRLCAPDIVSAILAAFGEFPNFDPSS